MTTIVNNAAFSIVVGASEVGPLSLPQGTRSLTVTYSNASWPVASDGTITVSLVISDDGGATWRTEWSDTFQHVQLKRSGVVQSTASFGIGLQAPFGATSRLRVAFNSSVAVATTVTVSAV